MASAFFVKRPYLVTPVDEIIVDELHTICDKNRVEREETIRMWGALLGCSKLRIEQLVYFYASMV